VAPGGSFDLRVAGSASSAYAATVLYEPGRGLAVESFNLTLEDEGVEGGVHVYKAHVPAGVKPGTYDLAVKLSTGETVAVPRGLWVRPSNLTRILVAHLSDLHFGAGDANVKLTAYLLTQLLGADIILNTGDEADTAAMHQYEQSLFYRYAFAFPVPMVLVPGNHDHPIDNFLKMYGNMSAFCWQGLPWLVAAGGYTDEVGYLTLAQQEAIRQCLEEHGNATVKIVMMHHPVFYWQGEVHLPPDYNFQDPHKARGSPLSYYWGGEARTNGALRSFLEMVVEYNVTIVLAGHIHRDQYVVYEPPGGGVHYFITTTTSGQTEARPNYNGIQAILIYENGSISFPYAPPSFIGFKNASRSTVYNSIPDDPHPRRAPGRYGYFYATYHAGPEAYVVTVENRYFYNIPSRIVVLALPQASTRYVEVNATGGARAEVVDTLNATLPGGAYTFIALNISLPANSSVKLVLAGHPDTQPPTARLSLTIPRQPLPGRPFHAYVKISDDVTGVMSANATAVDDKGRSVPVEVGDIPETLPGDLHLRVGPTKPDASSVTITLTLEDYAGHTGQARLEIPLKTAQTQATTTSPGTQATQPASTQQPTPTSQPSSQPQQPQSTAGGGGGVSAGEAAAIAVAVIVVAIAAALLARR
jgi:3',5'-cyclic AMP phosphodiesterase CpdA